MILPHPYALADAASFPGPLESGLIAHLTRDGRIVARVIDEGDQGPIVWQWRRRGRARGEDQDALDAYLDGLPPLVTKRISIPEWCPDAFIDQLRREARAVAWMLPYCEHHTVLLVMGIDGWGRWRLVDEPFAPRRAQDLAAAPAANLRRSGRNGGYRMDGKPGSSGFQAKHIARRRLDLQGLLQPDALHHRPRHNAGRGKTLSATGPLAEKPP